MRLAEEKQGLKFPESLAEPPKHWQAEYAGEAKDRGLPSVLDTAFERLKAFAAPLLDRHRFELGFENLLEEEIGSQSGLIDIEQIERSDVERGNFLQDTERDRDLDR
jgi:hypothetical protein